MNLCLNSAQGFQLLKTLPNSLTRNRFPPVIYKDLGNNTSFYKFRSNFLQVYKELFISPISKGNQSFFISFSMHKNQSFFKMQISKFQSANLANAKSTGINQFKKSIISFSAQACFINTIQKRIYLLYRKHLRKITCRFRFIKLHCGVFTPHSL